MYNLKINKKMKLRKFQEGGAMAPEAAPAPTPEQGGQPQSGGVEEQVAQMAQQIIQRLGPEAAAMLAEMIMQMLQGAAQQSQPTYQRKGGKMQRVRK